MSELEKFSRRDFIRGAAVSAVTIAGASALTGCSSQAECPPCETCEPCESCPEAGAGTAAAEQKWPWETIPDPIPDSEIVETYDTEILVIGAGVSGLSAAWAAAEGGAKVMIVEKSPTYNARGGDNTSTDSKIQKALGLELDKEKIVQQLIRWSGSKVDARLIWLWADNNGRVIDKIIDAFAEKGMESWLVVPDRTDDQVAVIDSWPNPPSLPDGWNYLEESVVEYPTCHRFGSKATNQMLLAETLEGKAKEFGAETFYETKVEQLLRPDNGRVTGCVAKNVDGDYVKYTASKAVILCTGDYGSSPEMMQAYAPQAAKYTGWVQTAKGEGHQMGMWIGGVMQKETHAPMTHMFTSMGTDAFLMVNKKGERFHNEDVDTQSLGNQCEVQGGLWVVVDSSWTEDVEKMGAGFFRNFRASETRIAEFNANVEAGSMLKADTIEELAELMKVPVDAFKATIDRYNELVALGEDLDYHKRADRLTAVDEPPYYASFSQGPGMLVILGGLVANEKLQVIDAEEKIIPGLYVAGNTLGRRFANDYPVICPGLSHSMAWTHGHLAGEFAVELEA
jgi:fumarate reductase flavoprotein subunit